MDIATRPPIRFDPAMEAPEENEAQITREIAERMSKINETTFAHGGVGLRSVHAKSHGLLRAELTVPALPPELAQGAFARPGRYPVLMRFSTNPGDILDDSVSTPRGLAIKIVGVEGARVAGSEGAATQDFVMVNGPAFQRPNAAGFLKDVKLLAPTTDKAEGAKKIISAVARGAEAVIEAFGGKSAKILGLGGQPETHILGETFYTQVPFLYGPYIAKAGVFPVGPALTALTDAPLDVNGKPDGLREAVVDFFRTHGGTWELRVQLCTDIEAMPIERADVAWPEDQSPYVAVGALVAEPQDAWSPDKVEAIDGGLSFSPWHALAAHRPLGSVMRARKTVYEMSARFRAEHNGRRITEPGVADLPA